MSDIVQKITGNFGIWQLRAALIIFLCKIPSSWFMACIIYTAPKPYDHELSCRQYKEPDSFNYNENNFTLIDECSAQLESLNGTAELPCEVFEHRAEYYSLIMQFDLVCHREIYIAWSQFWHLFGILWGGVAATKLMERINPKKVMLIGMISQIFCGIFTGFIPSFSLHCFGRVISAMCCALMFTSGQAILVDITGGKYRMGVVTLYDTFWAIGVILLPGLAKFYHSWSFIYLGISLPTVLLIVLYRWIPAPPRWLLKRKLIDEAQAILMESVEINDRKHTIPENLRNELENYSNTLSSAPPPAKWTALWKGPHAKRNFIAAHIAWAVYVTNFMGMLLNIRSFGRDFLDINTIITAISEIVGCFLALHFSLKSRNKWMSAGIYNIIAGLIGCLGWLIPHNLNYRTTVALWMIISSIPKGGVSISQSMLMAGSSELVSPNKRPIFVFSCVTWARIWLLTAPFINVLKVIDTAMSLMAFSILSLIGGIATCCFKTEIDNNISSAPQEGENANQNGVHSRSNVWTIESEKFEKTKL